MDRLPDPPTRSLPPPLAGTAAATAADERARAHPRPRPSHRRWFVIGGGILVVLMLFQGVMLLIGLWFRTSARGEQRITTTVRQVTVRASSGDVTVKPASEGAATTANWVSHYSFRRPTVHVTVEGDQVLVDARCSEGGWGIVLGPNHCSTDVDVVVPAGATVDVRTSAGDVSASSLTGPVSLRSSAGNVSFDEIRGPISARSSAGDVTGGRLDSTSVAAETSAGNVTLNFRVEPTSVSARSSAGNVHVAVPPGTAAYRVDASSSAGDRTVDVRTDPAATSTITARTSAGNVTVEYGT